MSLRFAAIISHPIQHYSPVFRELAQIPGMEVKAFYGCDHGVRESYDPGFDARFGWDIPLLEGHAHEILRPGYTPRRFGFWETDARALPARLETFRPHALWVHGYAQRLCWRAVRWARGRAAIILFGDSELVHPRRLFARVLKRIFLRIFFRRIDAFLTIGDNNQAYYRHYGVPEGKLFRGVCPVDVERFRRRLEGEPPEARSRIRSSHRFPPNDFVVISLGKLEPRKRPMDLVRAVALLRGRGVPASVLFVGDGPLRNVLLGEAASAGVEDFVKITGFVNQTDIPTVLLAGDVLAMPSEIDPHPLAVTEALIVGLPIVVSDRVGCVGPADTARPGVNALVYPCGDDVALSEAIERLATSESVWKRLSRASLEIAPTQDVSVTVKTVLEIFEALRPRFKEQWTDVAPETFRRFADYVPLPLRPEAAVSPTRVR